MRLVQKNCNERKIYDNLTNDMLKNVETLKQSEYDNICSHFQTKKPKEVPLMSSKEQAQQIIKAMKEDLKKRKKMSQEERRKTAVTQLQSIGVLDAK